MLRFAADTLGPMLERVVRASARHAKAVVLGYLALTLAAGWYTANNISINTDTDQLIDSTLPFRQNYRDFNAAFPQFLNSLVFVVDGATPEASEAVAKAIQAALAARPGQFQNTFSARLDPYFETNGFLFLDVDELDILMSEIADAQPILASLVEDESLRGLYGILSDALGGAEGADVPAERLATVLDKISAVIEARAKGSPARLSWQELLDQENAADNRRRLVVTQPIMDFASLFPARQALRAARGVVVDVEALELGATIQLTGKIAIGSEELRSVSEGATLSGILSLILVSVVLGFGIRSARLVTAALATLVVGLVLTAGFAIVAVGYFNMISVAFAVLFIGLGIDFAIHFSLRYQESIAAGADTDDALGTAGSGVGPALFVAAPTTALAFFAFIPTAYIGLAQLGLISGTGMFISLATSLTLLPALLRLMPLKPQNPVKPGVTSDRAKGTAVRLALTRKYAFIAIGLGILLAPLASRIGFVTDPLDLKDPSSPAVQAFESLLADPDRSPQVIQILAADRDAALALKSSVSLLPEVERAVILDDFVPEDQDAKLELIADASLFMFQILFGDGEGAPMSVDDYALVEAGLLAAIDGYGRGENDPTLAAAAARLAAALEAEAGSGEALERDLLGYFPATIEKLRASFEAGAVTLSDVPQAIVERYLTPEGIYRVEVGGSADLGDQDNLIAFVDAVANVAPVASGTPVQIVGAGRAVTGAMIKATALAGLLILTILWILVRSVRDIGLILTPVLLAGSYSVAVMALSGINFNFANVIVLPLLIGLGVDSGIHLVMRAREGGNVGAKIGGTSTPRAVLLSALTTIGSFGTLIVSRHQGMHSMGLLLTIAVGITLITALVILPGLIGSSKAPVKSS